MGKKGLRMLRDLFMDKTLDPSQGSEIFMTELMSYVNQITDKNETMLFIYLLTEP